ncbi:hypothetical protein GCM10022215_34230 [Nocardioides fonticola]|uniref:MmcQ/YjbR family DNA-binding protein n=1 Tax=Nocardioides fonticola TaxID=450363 RepID=A0ABP7XTD0_9ACTN
MAPAAGDGRPARPDDVDAVCRSLPEVVFGTSWGDVPTYLVRGKGFVRFRAPRHDAVDPVSGEMYDDLVVIETPGPAERDALIGDPATPFFTIEHFRRTRSNAVLVQQSRLGEITLAELRETLTDAWASRAPKTLVRGHRGDV